jgi:uncharacterized repeat protein (TIGR03843 family)
MIDGNPAMEGPWQGPIVDPAVVSQERILRLLAKGTLTIHGLLPWSTNDTFLVTVAGEGLQTLAVYKPRRGERSLWDFPNGTLYRREYAAYLVSEGLAWHIVPPTVVRKGPYGIGCLQLYIDADPSAHYFAFRGRYTDQLQRIALFDYVTNNADRKAGHCLLDRHGRLWAIDHGITFHAEFKLRTVIWDFVGQEIPRCFLDDLHRLLSDLEQGPLVKSLTHWLSPEEIEATRQRLRLLIRLGRFPGPGRGMTVPWPPV